MEFTNCNQKMRHPANIAFFVLLMVGLLTMVAAADAVVKGNANMKRIFSPTSKDDINEIPSTPTCRECVEPVEIKFNDPFDTIREYYTETWRLLLSSGTGEVTMNDYREHLRAQLRETVPQLSQTSLMGQYRLCERLRKEHAAAEIAKRGVNEEGAPHAEPHERLAELHRGVQATLDELHEALFAAIWGLPRLNTTTAYWVEEWEIDKQVYGLMIYKLPREGPFYLWKRLCLPRQGEVWERVSSACSLKIKNVMKMLLLLNKKTLSTGLELYHHLCNSQNWKAVSRGNSSRVKASLHRKSLPIEQLSIDEEFHLDPFWSIFSLIMIIYTTGLISTVVLLWSLKGHLSRKKTHPKSA